MLRAEGDASRITPAEIERTVSALLKEAQDVGRLDAELLERLDAAARDARERVAGTGAEA
jgi:hypothetical protein